MTLLPVASDLQKQSTWTGPVFSYPYLWMPRLNDSPESHTQLDHRSKLVLGQVQLASEASVEGMVVTAQGQLAILCGWHPSVGGIASPASMLLTCTHMLTNT